MAKKTVFRFPPKRILVPMDLSEPSFAALEVAKNVARKCGASLELVYVQDTGFNIPAYYPDGTVAAMPGIDKLRDEFRTWCAHKLRQSVKDLPPSRVRVRTVSGQPAATLVDLAKERSAGLIVMGMHGYAGLDRALFGSVAEAVVRRVTVPVLTVHRGSVLRKISRILIPCNMTPYAGRALAYALELSRSLRARAQVFYVIPPGANKHRAEEQLRRHVSSVAGSRGASRLELAVAEGDSREVILSRIARGRFDLIVLSAHRRPFSSDLVLGSTVERVLRHSRVPVLSVPSVETGRWSEVRLSMGGIPANKIYVPA